MNAPVCKKKIDRTMSGLRDAMFEVLEEVKERRLDPEIGQCCAGIAKVIIESVKVQLLYEQLRLADKVPSHLPNMNLLPPLGK